MKKIIVISLLGCFNHSFAEVFDIKDHMNLTDQQKYEIFTKNGLPFPGEPPKIISKKESYKLIASMPKEVIARQKKIAHSIATKGYAEEININAVKILSDKERMKADVQNNLDNKNPMHSHLRAGPENLTTGFQYKTFSSDIASEIIGFSPLGSYIKDFGWSGAAEFFVPIGLGEGEKSLCIHNQTSIKMNGTTTSYPEDKVSYVVNNKLSAYVVIGNTDTAFTYKVEWWDTEIFHELECFQKDYSKEKIDKVIELAKKIDKSITNY